MRCSLTVAEIEVELSIQAPSLEAVIARRYAPFLGRPVEPVASVCLELSPRTERSLLSSISVFGLEGRGEVHLESSDTSGVEFLSAAMVRTPPTPGAVDRALQMVFSNLMPAHRGLMLNACGVIWNRTAQVIAGGSDAWRSELAGRAGRRPLLSTACVAVRQIDGLWVAASTPFMSEMVFPPRQAPLAQLWLPPLGPFARRASGARSTHEMALEETILAGTEPACRDLIAEVVTGLFAAVPVAELPPVPTTRLWHEVARRPRVFDGVKGGWSQPVHELPLSS